jgi:hypothetical protein
MDGDDGIGGIVLAAQHLLHLSRVDLGLECVESIRQVAGDIFATLRPFDQHAGVVDPPLERVTQLDVLAEALTTPQYRLRLGLIVPEIRRANPRLQPAQLLIEQSLVKDNSAGRRPVSAGRWNVGSDHR